MSERRLRVGLIGCGRMGLQHLRVINGIETATIVGVADPKADREAIGKELGRNVPVFADVDRLFNEATPEVVHIVTPPGTHTALAARALEQGVNVYLEKPFTLTRKDAEQLLSLAADRNLRMCAGHQYLFEDPAKQTREYLREIGRIVHVESYFSFRTVRRSISSVDQLKDILPHAVYPLVDLLRRGDGADDQVPIVLKAVDVRSNGDVYGLVGTPERTGIVMVTLNGRPIEQYVRVVGTNGTIEADFVSGSVVKLAGPGSSAVAVLQKPYRVSLQTVVGSTRGFAKRILNRKVSYPGLEVLIKDFYHSIANRSGAPLTPRSIIETVSVCEEIGMKLDEADGVSEEEAKRALERRARALPQTVEGRGTVCVTGGAGVLGRVVSEELRSRGWPVRVIVRRMLRYSERLPGVEYRVADLGESLAPDLLQGTALVVHCAAETAGGKQDHERNSVQATQNLLAACERGRIRRVIHISSLAVLKPRGVLSRPLYEESPLDLDNLGRGPYVWGKAESERVATEFARQGRLEVKIIRPGPLVDYERYTPPGRLGRELGTLFVMPGSWNSTISLCEVHTAARVIRAYAEDFAAAPQLLNLVEAEAPTRRELIRRLREQRPDLRIVRMPMPVLSVLSAALILLQRIIAPRKQPLNVKAAFTSERYNSALAATVIARAERGTQG